MLTSLVCLLMAIPSAADAPPPAPSCDITWTTPSDDAKGSMPLGNGDMGVNLWVEPNGDIVFYIGKTDAWSENGRLLKLGKVRVSFSPNPFKQDLPFAQTLDLHSGVLSIRFGSSLDLTAWVDANHPALRLSANTSEPTLMKVALEPWRTEDRALEEGELFSAYGLVQSPGPVVCAKDAIIDSGASSIAWYHRNERSIWPMTLEHQGMGEWTTQGEDPLLHRTFGAIIEGQGMAAESPLALCSEKPAQKHEIALCALTTRTESADQWLQQAQQALAAAQDPGYDAALNAHKDWWHAFWDRSWIHLSGPEEAQTITQAYALQRYIGACAGRGGAPIKFNGTIFNVDEDEKGKHYDADYRRWGGPYWFQNTRLVYWPMLYAGDFDTMQPLFRMFLDALPFARARTQAYFGHGGAYFPETMYFWGAYANDNYGWAREGKPISHIDNKYIRWYYQNNLELLALALDYFAFTQDASFARETLIPLAEAFIPFFDEHYDRDEAGKLQFKPAQSLETWQDVVNPLPEIAGLHDVLPRLRELPAKLGGHRALWERLEGELPPIPTTEADGQRLLAPASEILADAANSECPELYAIFPYPLYGIGRPDLDMARRSFAARRVKGNNGWRQDDIQAACLGLANEAREYLAGRFANKNPQSRFPAFWGPNFDWIPDQDHGGVGLIALQRMLMQCRGKTIYLLPAWPKAWEVDFRLHAPLNTTVEGTYRNGELERLRVTPPEREADIRTLIPQ